MEYVLLVEYMWADCFGFGEDAVFGGSGSKDSGRVSKGDGLVVLVYEEKG